MQRWQRQLNELVPFRRICIWGVRGEEGWYLKRCFLYHTPIFKSTKIYQLLKLKGNFNQKTSGKINSGNWLWRLKFELSPPSQSQLRRALCADVFKKICKHFDLSEVLDFGESSSIPPCGFLVEYQGSLGHRSPEMGACRPYEERPGGLEFFHCRQSMNPSVYLNKVL